MINFSVIDKINLDHDSKGDLIPILKKLLNDRSCIVLGSAVAAFSEICPERLDLLHQHFRKLCARLSDLDEWGQISVLRVLIRYSRTQFLNPRVDLNTGEEAEAVTSGLNDSLATNLATSYVQREPTALELALDAGTEGFFSDDEELA